MAVVLTELIFLANIDLGRPLCDSLLFSLAIAVGITPQLVPAVVSTCLEGGTRVLAKRQVLVKRPVCIEDLGGMEVLVTDKTGTPTEVRISFTAALPACPDITEGELFVLGRVSTKAGYSRGDANAAGQNPLDAASWEAPAAGDFEPANHGRLGLIPFDHGRRRTTALVGDAAGNQTMVTKGSPGDLLPLCVNVRPEAQALSDRQYDAESCVVAVASRPAADLSSIEAADERGLSLDGFLDKPKSNARDSLVELSRPGITVKIATEDNARVAEKAGNWEWSPGNAERRPD